MLNYIEVISEAVLQLHKLNGKQILDIVAEITGSCYNITKAQRERLMFDVMQVLYNRYNKGDKSVPFIDGPPLQINFPHAFPFARKR